MGSFISNLTKGFIRSTVNQVGRDGGRVISNQIYGDKHSIPIRNVGTSDSSILHDVDIQEVSDDVLRSQLLEEGYKPRYCKFHPVTKVVWYIVSWIVNIMPIIGFVPPIIIFIIGINKCFSKQVVYEKKVQVSSFVPDRRYKTGRRLAGYVEDTVKAKLNARKEDRIKNIKIGLFYIAIAIFTIIISMRAWDIVLDTKE